MRELIKRVSEYGLRVHAAHLPDGIFGHYSPEESRIYFDFDLTPNERQETIAHELGHAHYGHTCDSDRAERQADTFAAQLLIHPEDYARYERISSDRHYLADEIGVTVHLIDHYRAHCLQRLGQRTYSTIARSRLTNRLARALS